jgi:dipeptidyl aminopeptidase/acylaminoacyl peptidase
MKTPTLVMHGLLDYRVPDNQGLAYYNTLQAKAIPSRLVFFPDENHWILKPQNSRLWYREFFEWLGRFGGTKRARARAPSRRTRAR